MHTGLSAQRRLFDNAAKVVLAAACTLLLFASLPNVASADLWTHMGTTVVKDDNGDYWYAAVLDTDEDGEADLIWPHTYASGMYWRHKPPRGGALEDDDNPAPDDPAGEFVFPWEVNPLNLGQSTYPLHPAVIGLEQALQMDGGGALVHGGPGRDSLVNPADDDNGNNSGPKPKTQTTGGDNVGVPILSSLDLTIVEEQVGAANSLALGDAAYVQLHNPAGQQGGPDTDGDDDAPTTAGPKKDGPMTPGGNGMPSLWDAEHDALVNPPVTPGGSSFVLLQPSASGFNLQGGGHTARSQGPDVNFGSFGGGGSSRGGMTTTHR